MGDMIKLLYVDDEPMNLKLFTANFKNRFDVLVAHSGHEGLKQMKNDPGISAVISDMRMPEMSGMEFIRTAKEDYPDVSYFILTGYDMTDEISEALKQGLIQKFFRKPFDIKDIEESVRASVQ